MLPQGDWTFTHRIGAPMDAPGPAHLDGRTAGGEGRPAQFFLIFELDISSITPLHPGEARPTPANLPFARGAFLRCALRAARYRSNLPDRTITCLEKTC